MAELLNIVGWLLDPFAVVIDCPYAAVARDGGRILSGSRGKSGETHIAWQDPEVLPETAKHGSAVFWRGEGAGKVLDRINGMTARANK